MRKVMMAFIIIVGIVIVCGWYQPVRDRIIPVLYSTGETVRLAILNFGGSPLMQSYGYYIVGGGAFLFGIFLSVFGHRIYNAGRKRMIRSTVEETGLQGAPVFGPQLIPRTSPSTIPTQPTVPPVVPQPPPNTETQS